MNYNMTVIIKMNVHLHMESKSLDRTVDYRNIKQGYVKHLLINPFVILERDVITDTS